MALGSLASGIKAHVVLPQADEDGVLPHLSAPVIMLGGLILPLPALWAMTTPFALLIALLGHPWIAVASAVANMTGDWIAQTLYRRWALTVAEGDDTTAIKNISLVVCIRSAIATSGIVAVGLIGGSLADLTFCGIMASMLLCVAVTQGTLSPRLLWMSAWPVMAGMIITILAAFPTPTAATLIAAVGLVAAMLFLLGSGLGRVMGEWSEMRDSNNRLIERLKAERREADVAREDARLAGEAKANFLATMSHEIRTPMNGVLGMAQLLKRNAAESEQREQIETLIHSGEYLMSILNDILDISRIDAGLLEVSTGTENLEVMLSDVERLWQPSAQEKGLVFAVEATPDLPVWLAMDARRVRQVLFNLIGNALKFTSIGGVTLRVEHDPVAEGRHRLRISVQDTGIGIDPEALPALFERFSQADQSISRQFGGAGLGLAISRQLTELMGGKLWAESVPGAGSCFHLELELDVVDAPDTGQTGAGEVEDDRSPRALSVLIVDDNAVNLMVLDKVLTAIGHVAVRANSGLEALRLAAVEPFDLILLDIRMPGMSGLQALQALRSGDGPNRETPALAVTADVLTHAHGGYLSLGFAGHVSKPIQVTSLMAEIETVMSGASDRSVAA